MDNTHSQDVALATAELAGSSVRELRDLRVDGTNSGIQLTGHVRSFYHKQLAQEMVRSVAPGKQVINRVRVSA